MLVVVTLHARSVLLSADGWKSSLKRRADFRLKLLGVPTSRHRSIDTDDNDIV